LVIDNNRQEYSALKPAVQGKQARAQVSEMPSVSAMMRAFPEENGK